MKIKEYNRDYIESSIKNGKSYLELGREYGVSDTMIKKYKSAGSECTRGNF